MAVAVLHHDARFVNLASMFIRHVIVLACIFLLSGSIVVHTMLDTNGWKKRRALQADLLRLTSDNDAVQAQILDMRRQIDGLLHRTEVQERVVRDALGWVKNGELVLHMQAHRE